MRSTTKPRTTRSNPNHPQSWWEFYQAIKEDKEWQTHKSLPAP